MSDKVHLTKKGYDRLQLEFVQLKSVERPSIIQAIADARLHGDLSENAEYHTAKDRQGFIEGRIKELEVKLSRAEVIDVSKMSGDKVKFGATVKLLDVDTDKETTYQIVGADESSIEEGLLSIKAPLAKALIGKEQGDEIHVSTPNGQKIYELLQVQYI